MTFEYIKSLQEASFSVALLEEQENVAIAMTKYIT